MAIDSRKYFDAAQDRKNDLSKEFGAAHASDGKPYDLSAVVEAANNFLGGYDPQSPEDVRRSLYDAATNPGSLGASVMVTSHTPNLTPEQQKKKEEEAHDALLRALQEQIRQANERISKMIDKCLEMAEWCRKQAEKAAEAMDKIATRMAKNSQFIEEVDELFESFKANGQFDREKARRLLQERGIKTDEKISDAKLMELLKAQKDEATKDILRDTKSYDEWEKQKQQYEESAEEIDRLARELKQRRDEINKLENPSERAQRLKELEEEYHLQVRNMAEILENNSEEIQKLQSNNETAFINSSAAKPSTEKETSSFMADFGASATPTKQGIKLEESGIEDALGPAKHTLKNSLSSV